MAQPDRMRSSAPVSAPYDIEDLDRDPATAYEAFYRYAVAHLSTYPPGPLRSVPVEDRLDLIHEVVMHCCRQEFRVLRRFDSSRSFSTWFGFVARNQIIDVLRRTRGDLRNYAILDEDDQLGELRASTADPAEELVNRDLLAKVEVALRGLNTKCQVLLLGAAEGRAPRQMLELLGWPKSMNKKASDDLRACRSRLIRRLRESGIRVAEFTGDR